GSLEFDGSAITAVEIVADLTQLKSDDDRRDGRLRTQGIEWGTFPEAAFVLAQPVAIDGVPADGETISATAVGDLTLHGVTKRVEFPLEGTLSNGMVVVVGSLLIQFADYDMEAPSAIAVVSVEEQGTIELQMVFSR
ncbi:MAG: YceI family protein, partial [Dehalococcoidia bacterium]|nr:YceI family protein [Dehalococcoidia bacterium]